MAEKKPKAPTTPAKKKRKASPKKVAKQRVLLQSGEAIHVDPKKVEVADAVGGWRGIVEAMKEAGYAEHTAKKHSGRLYDDPEFQKLLNERLPHDLITQKHNELLTAKNYTTIQMPKTMTQEEASEAVAKLGVEIICTVENINGVQWDVMVAHTDRKTVMKAVELAYRVRGGEAPTKNENLNMNVSVDLSEVFKRSMEFRAQR